jgi:glycosyltransferase involved in cell wall biosynthesis
VLSALGPVLHRNAETRESLLAAAERFRPDAVLVSGWNDRVYASVCADLKRRGVPIISGCDNQWTGSLRQRTAAATSPLYVHRFIDVLWVAGERQRMFANALGYRGERCWEGYYACDIEAFTSSSGAQATDAPHFLYVGRYVPEKGLTVLATAYQAYRTRVERPWRLVCAGAGPLRERLIACGAEDRGFVQPHDLPALMKAAHAFVLPSTFEPWGVVLQEAAAAGLPLIASHACGAAVHLLRAGYNGYSCEPGDVEGLASALLQMHHASEEDRRTMGSASTGLAKQFTPDLWAATLQRGVGLFRNGSVVRT